MLSSNGTNPTVEDVVEILKGNNTNKTINYLKQLDDWELSHHHLLLVTPLIDQFQAQKQELRELAKQMLFRIYEKFINQKQQSQMIQQKIIQKGYFSKSPNARKEAIQFTIMAASLGSVKVFIPSLVTLLQDSQENLRQESREGLVKLYRSSRNLNMKGDILKEMQKQSIRQVIADGVAKELELEDSKDDDNNETANTKGTSAPEPTPLSIESGKDLLHELELFFYSFDGKETEHNWALRDQALHRLRAILKGLDQNNPAENNDDKLEVFSLKIKKIIEIVIANINSLRSALVLSACALILDLADYLKTVLDPVIDILLPSLLKISGSSKKLVATTAMGCVKRVMQKTSFSIKSIQIYNSGLNEKSGGIRLSAAEIQKLVLERLYQSTSLQAQVDTYLDDLEKGIKKSIEDSDATVRKFGRDAFWYFNSTWPTRGGKLLLQLEPAVQKAVAKESAPVETFKYDDRGSIGETRGLAAFACPISTPTKAKIPASPESVQLTPVPSVDDLSEILSLAPTCAIEEMDYLLDIPWLKSLVDRGVETQELFVIMLKINIAHPQYEKPREFIDYVLGHGEKSTVATMLLKSVSTIISPPTFKSRKSLSDKQIELDARFEVIKMVSNLLSECEEFWDTAQIRLVMNVVIPLIKITKLKEDCQKLLGLAHEHSPEIFQKTLETFDYEVAAQVCKMLDISDEKDEEVVQIEELAKIPPNEPPVAVDISTDSIKLGGLAGTVLTPKRTFQSRFSDNKFFEVLGQTPKQVKFASYGEELDVLISIMKDEPDISTAVARLFKLSRRHSAIHWEDYLPDLIDAIFSRIEMDEMVVFGLMQNLDEQEQCLILLKEFILNQGRLLVGQEKRLFDLSFKCRSDGSPQVSGAAQEVLLSVVEMNTPSKSLEILFSMLHSYDLDNPNGPAFQVRQSKEKHPFKPFPLSSCLYAIGKAIANCSTNDDAHWLETLLLPWVQRELSKSHITVRKACYDCLLECVSLLNGRFWVSARKMLTEQQCTMIAAMEKQMQ